jgi:soluble lytic murein transglycosylase
MMRSCLARAIPARWSRIHAILLLFSVAALPAAAQDLASLVKAYRDTPSVARRARIEQLASLHAKDQTGALAQLALGVASFEQKDYDRATRYLKAAQARLPKIEDYAVYYSASARLQAKDEAGIPKQLQTFQTLPIASPLAARAVVLQAKALVDLQNPAEAVRILRERYADLPQPDADLTLAGAYEAASDPVNAAAYYQHVYFGSPDTEAAVRAAAAIVLLKNAMGAAYPPATPELILKRGDRWLAAREYKQARQEFASMVAELGGVERDQARVRIGAADYLRGETPAAFRYLQSLDVGRSEADAERLYYLAECQRRMNDHDDMLVTVKRLSEAYPQSPWRLKALVSAANSYLLQNRPDIYEPLYKAAYQDFPNDTTAAYSHWKVSWSAYIRRRPDADDKLRAQIEQYPAAPMTGAAIYFLARLSERDNDFAAARTYYAKIVALFPNFYYSTLALQRLSEPRLVAAEPSAKIAQFLNGIAFAERRVPAERELSSTTQLRIERARLLAAAGLPELAESELRFGARNDGQPHLLAVELARTAPSAYLGLRYMKSFAPDYLATPIDQMPRRFWELLFPVPYQKDLVRNAKLQNLDACVVAALIRQESEFNPAAISRKNAYGLTQLMPATGRQLARRNGVRRFRTSMLFQPATNLQLGERYLRSMLDQWGGKWEETLASYNAGKTHVDEWLGWNYSFQEPAEFVETIPFTETREYVQAVLRNAAIYRRLYGTSLAALPSTDGGTSDRASTKSAARPTKHKRSRSVS